jgi:hypothetical protein
MSLSRRLAHVAFARDFCGHMSLFNLFLVLALTLNVLSEPIPKLNQRFSAAFKISHPLTGTLGQGVVWCDYAKHSVRGIFLEFFIYPYHSSPRRRSY